MEKRLVLFFVLAFVIFALHSKLFGPPSKQINKSIPVNKGAPAQVTPQIKEVSQDIPVIEEDEKEKELLSRAAVTDLRASAEIVYLENPFMKVGISTLGGGIQECVLRSTDIIRGEDYQIVNPSDEDLHPGGISRFGEFVATIASFAETECSKT